MTNGDFIRSMSDADIRENFTQLLCEFVQRKQTSRCRSREHCFHCIKDWLKEESVALRRADDDTDEIRKLRGMTLSEFSRQSGLSPHTARNLMGYRELYGNPRLDTMVDAARALNAVVTISPKGVTIRARKESA